MCRGSLLRVVFRPHVVPVVEILKIDRFLRISSFYMPEPFITTDVRRQLHIIQVKISVAVRLDISAVFVVVLINKTNLRTVFIQNPRFSWEFSHHPLVPSRHEYKIGIHCNCVVPLLLDIVAVFIRILRQLFVFKACRIASAVRSLIVEMRADSAVARILRYADGTHFVSSVRFFHVTVLRRDFQPAPLILSARASRIHGLRRTKCKEAANFIQKRRIKV